MEPDPGVELPPEIAEQARPSWLYRSSRSPPNKVKKMAETTGSQTTPKDTNKEKVDQVRVSSTAHLVLCPSACCSFNM